MTHALRSGLSTLTFDVFKYLLNEGQVVVIFDGFDEMATTVNEQITARNFSELAKGSPRSR